MPDEKFCIELWAMSTNCGKYACNSLRFVYILACHNILRRIVYVFQTIDNQREGCAERFHFNAKLVDWCIIYKQTITNHNILENKSRCFTCRENFANDCFFFEAVLLWQWGRFAGIQIAPKQYKYCFSNRFSTLDEIFCKTTGSKRDLKEKTIVR